MRYLVLAAVAAAILGACAGQARASLLPPPNTNNRSEAGDSLVFTTETVVTSDVNPSGPSASIDPATRAAYPSGCRQVDVAAVAKSFLFKSVIYKFHQIKHWCWRNGVVYDERHSWSFQGSSTACFNTVYPPNAWFFAWNGKAQGGHYSEERAWVTNCVFKIGSWNQLYPDVRIWAYANGSYSSATAN